MASILTREGIEANLLSENPILKNGEVCIVIDKGNSKVGNGTDTFSSLPYNQITGILDAGMLLGNTALGLDYLCPYVATTSNSTSYVTTSLRTVWIPFYLNETITVSSLIINVSVQATGGTTYIGIYDTNASKMPNSRLAVSSLLDCSTTGNKVYTLGTTITLSANTIYFVAINNPSLVSYTLLAVSSVAVKSILHTSTLSGIRDTHLYLDSQTELAVTSSTPTVVSSGVIPLLMLGASR